MRRMRVKDLSRRPAARALAMALLAIGVMATAARMAHDPSASAPMTAPAKTAPAASAALMAATAPAAAPAEKAAGARSQMVTITGCLERDDESFRLKDTAGADAPRSRSWKTGFLTKRRATIDVADATNRLKLQNHIGQRVSVTGTLIDRDMQVRSLQRVGPCGGTSKA
jgi:hypothetical protein